MTPEAPVAVPVVIIAGSRTPLSSTRPLVHDARGRQRALVHCLAEIAALSLDFDIQLSGRIKSVGSTSCKMQRYSLDADQVLDILGIRIVTERTKDCYRLARRIRCAFPVLSSECNDYIAAPKSNGYRSLHTTVVSPYGFPIEVQIRTRAMHAHAQFGAASHVRYKQLQASVPSHAW